GSRGPRGLPRRTHSASASGRNETRHVPSASCSRRRRCLDPVHDEHLRDRRTQAALEGRLVLGRVVPALSRVKVLELNYYEASRRARFAVRSRYLEGVFEGSRPGRPGGGVRNDERGSASRRGGGGAERDDHLGGDAHLLRGGGRPDRASAVLLIRG